jgi:hypothetical protein
MNISLLFDFKEISSFQWEKVWKECCRVLRFFPVPLGSLYSEKKWENPRYVWRTDFIQDKGTENEFLSFKTDMVSLEYGGTCELYRNLGKYPVRNDGRDILWAEERKIDYLATSPATIWNIETGGAPYSLAILALGILLENRFPNHCVMHGDYSDEQVERMRVWLAEILQTTVADPICNNPDRLWERLRGIFSQTDLLVRRFRALTRLDTQECFRFLIDRGYSDALQNELIREMTQYEKVSQWGVIDVLYPYLEITEDLEQIVKLVQTVQKKNKKADFSLTLLLSILVDDGITINPFQGEIVGKWKNSNISLTTNVERFNRTLLRMAGFPTKIDFYISPDKLLEIFGCTEPANGVKFQKIIENGTKRCQEKYQKLEEVSEELFEKLEEKINEKTSYFETKAFMIQRNYLPSEEYILAQVEIQAPTFNDPEEMSLYFAEQFGKMIRLYNEKYDQPYAFPSREAALRKLTTDIRDQFALRETSWEAIDEEQDLNILTMLTVFTDMKGQEKTFWDWRKFILESPELWPEMRDVFLMQVASTE